jgi:hypothetical protein
MLFIRYVYRNINLLNALLITVITVVIVFLLLPLFRMKVKYVLPAGKPRMVQEVESAPEKAQPPSPLDYVIIGEANLFHPERKIPPEKKEEKALPKPELVLYGTIIGDKISLAYLEDKKNQKTTPGRGKRQITAKIGDTFSGFVLKEIGTDRIALVRGEESMTVYLTEAGKQRGGGSGAAAPSGPARPGTSGAPVAPSAFPSPRAAAPGPVSPPVIPPGTASQGVQTSPAGAQPTTPVRPRGRMGGYPPGVPARQ